MNVLTWLKASIKQLTEAGIGTARLDTLVLLEDCLGLDRAHILAHPELTLTNKHVTTLAAQLKQRENHQPLAYVRGKTEFYGREFIITTVVLEPRPESETMIELLLELTLPAKPRIVDVGTGSGAIGITAQLELPEAIVDLTDIDKKALTIAKKNLEKYNLELSCVLDNLIQRAHHSYDIILANLPYVPNTYHINDAAQNEPKIAIFGGKDGLDIYRQLFAQINSFTWKPSYILTESLPFQHNGLASIAKQSKFSLQTTSDFIQVFVNKI